MDLSTEGEIQATAAGEIRRPEQRGVRLRLVQSTLFPHRSPDADSNVDQNGDKKGDGDCGDEEGQDEEHCGSQGKKKRSRKGKAIKDPKKHSKERSPANSTPRKNAKSDGKTTPKSNAKSDGKTTPKSNAKSDEKTTPKRDAKSAYFMENGDASPPIPNLRLEAKIVAEENSRMFAGKQIHPFFSSWKTNKRYQETTEADSDCSLVQQKYKSITFGPIHVFERDQDDAVSFDWRNWKFCEKSFTCSSSPEGPFSSVFEGSVEPLHINKFCSGSNPIGSSLLQDSLSFNKCHQEEVLNEASERVSVMSSDAQLAFSQHVMDTKTECEIDEVGLFTGCVREADAAQQSEHFQERILSCYLDCANQLDDQLWTDKYQPKKATEVCGNNESVKFLSEWLCSWHQRTHQTSKDYSCGDEYHVEDGDDIWFGSDSDSENGTQEASHTNLLLVTGPVGSGKSAAIYACAKEQGFKVLEVNASECRNGAIVKQRFGEALESHFLEWSKENNAESQITHILKYPNGKTALDDEVVEVIPILDEDNSHGATETSGKFVSKDSSIANGSGQVKPLILFEDVDITFPEDRGLIAAIQHIAEKAKGPVILTSSSDNPELPDNLDRIELSFKMPSDKELLHNVHMVCSAEKVSVQPHLVHQLVKYCQGDIRKTIMHLQFWCQGKRLRKGRELSRLSGPLLFDTEAIHQILPRMIPWDFPSWLSELVEKEITKALAEMDENSYFMKINEELVDQDMQNSLEMHGCEEDNIDAKKEAMLRRNCSDHNCNDFIVPLDTACDLLNSLGTPVSVFRRNSRRKLNVVMSSDSEDEILKDRFPSTSGRHTEMGLFLEVNGASTFNSPGKQNCSSPSNDVQLCSEAGKLDENHYQCLEAITDSHVHDTCKSVDVSCVLESSFVPETEFRTDTEAFSRMCSTINENSVSNGFKQNLYSIEADSLDKSIPMLHKDSDLLGRPCDIIMVSSHEEVVEDSLNAHEKTSIREYQLMDECSRMDFNRKLKPVENTNSNIVENLVQESWRKLRNRRTELRHFVASENQDTYGIINLAYGISNLISEAELLCFKRQSQDSLELPVTFSEESDTFNRCDEHLHMTSTIESHGFCSYAKDIAAVGLKMGYESKVAFTWEMLSTTCMKEVHSLIKQDLSASNTSDTHLGSKVSLPESGLVPNSEAKTCLFDIIQSIVPSRSYMTLKGEAFYEYLSSLRHISRSEASRLSEGFGKRKGRRGRATRNYLNAGALSLSPEDISLLAQSNIYGKNSSKSTETDIK